MRFILPGVIIAVVAHAVSIAGAEVRPPTPTPMVVGKRDCFAGPMMVELAGGFRKAQPQAGKAKLTVGPHDYATVGRFADKDDPFNALIVTSPLDEHSRKCLARRFPAGAPQPETFMVGQRRIAVVVHRRNKLASIDVADVGKPLHEAGKVSNWRSIGGSKASPIHCYTEGEESWSRKRLRTRHMTFSEQGPGYVSHGFLPFSEDVTDCIDGDEVIAAVARDVNGLGYFHYTGQRLKGVKLLAIVDESGRPVRLRTGSVIQEDYPLAEHAILYLHPNAPDVARRFCQFAVSEAGATIAAKHKLTTPRANNQAEAERRLAAMKAGEGDTVAATGIIDGTELMKQLAVEYTKSDFPLQMNYTGQEPLAAVGSFLEGKDLLVLNGRVTDNPRLKARWAAGSKKFDEEAGIEEHPFAARAAAVVVHKLNKADRLTTRQLRAIFSGKVKDWTILGLADAATTKAEIHCYGLEQSHPVFPLFYQRLNLRDSSRLERKASSAEVLTAMTVDPNAIGFVSASDVPKDLDKMGLKLLPIDDGKGPGSPRRAKHLERPLPAGRALLPLRPP